MTEIDVKIWQQANSVYALIADLSVADALARLDTIHDISDDVREVVITLINSGDQSSQYFREQVASQFSMPQRQMEWKAGDVIAHYELVEEIGRGGMSQVFKAQRTDSEIQKMVALKVFSPRQNSHQLLDHFLGEQNILSGLSHKHIVAMHHGGTTEEDVSYIAMELIEEASSVDTFVKDQQLSRRKIVNMMRQAADAIAYAHNNLIIHRDIKPSNIMVDKDGHLKVVDFGIAKLIARDALNEKTTIMALTPSFAAPEQINNEKIGTYTDIFSLAAVTLSLLTEQAPFPKDRLLKSCNTDEPHLWQVLKSSGLDSDLKNILNKALQSEPDKRYQSMHDFGRDLERWLADEPVSATRDSWLYRLRKFARRRSALFASTVTLLATAAVGFSMLLWQYNQTRIEAEKAREVKEFMLGVFSVLDPNSDTAASISAKDLLAQAGSDLQSRQFANQEVKSEMMAALGIANMQLGVWDTAEEYLQQASELSVENNNSRLQLASLYEQRNEYDQAQAELDAIIEHDSSYQNDPEWLLIQANVDGGATNYASARKKAERAMAGFKAAGHVENVVEANIQLATLDFLESDSASGIQRLQSTLAEYGDLLSNTNTKILSVKYNLVELYNDSGQYEESLALGAELEQDVRRVLGNEHPTLPLLLLSRAGTFRAVGKLEEAEVLSVEAYNLSAQHFGENHQNTARVMNMLAALSYSRGAFPEALERMQKVADIYDNTVGEMHAETWEVKANLGALMNMNGLQHEALELLKPVYQAQLETLGVGHRSSLHTGSQIARLYVDTGQVEEGVSIAGDVVNAALSELGLEHPVTIGAHFTLGKAYEAAGDYSQAIETMLVIDKNQLLGADNERIISYYNSLGDVFVKNGDIAQADEFKHQSLQSAEAILGVDAPRYTQQLLRYVRFLQAHGNADTAATFYQQLQEAVTNQPDHIETMRDQYEALVQIMGS